MLKICLFGYPSVYVDDVRVAQFASDKALATLVFVLTTQEVQARDKLAGLFWGGVPETKARTSLRSALYNIGQIAGAALQIGRKSVQPNTDFAVTIDINDLAYAVKHPDANFRNLRTVLSEYRGSFLEGFYINNTPEFDRWVLVERERWRQTVIDGFNLLASYDLRVGDPERAVTSLQMLTQLEPWLESAYRDWMLCLGRIGRYDEALRVYNQCVLMLEEELSVDPSSETVAVNERIRVARQSIRHNLPRQATGFFGRKTILSQIDAAITSDHRLLTIVGAGGMGKTRLAIMAGSRLARRFLNGVAFVRLAGIEVAENQAAERVADAVINQLVYAGIIAKDEGGQPILHLLTQLRQRELLLILDNFEQLLAATSLILHLLDEIPSLTMLVTTRERLNISAETIFYLDGLGIKNRDKSLNPSVQLFIDIAHNSNPIFDPSAEDTAAIQRICQLVDGMPLAITLAAAHTRAMSCHAIAIVLERDIALQDERRDLPTRHRSLQAVFAGSWQPLTAQTKKVLAYMSLFRGGFKAKAAHTIAGADNRLLTTLVDKSLIQWDQVQARYSIHELLRKFNEDKLRQNPAEYNMAADHHAAYYLNALTCYFPKILTGDTETLRLITNNHENILAAWYWASERRQYALLVGVSFCFAVYLDMTARYEQGEGLYRYALTQLDDSPQETEVELIKLVLKAGVQGALVNFLLHQNKHTEVETRLGESLAIYKQLKLEFGEAHGAYHFGRFYIRVGRIAETHQSMQRCIQLFKKLDEQQGLGQSYAGNAIIMFQVGNYQVAYEQAQLAYMIFSDSGDQRGLALSVLYSALAHTYLGELEQAAEQLSLFSQIDVQRWQFVTLYANFIYSEYALANGDSTAAIILLDQAIALGHTLNYATFYVNALMRRAQLHLAANEFTQALVLHDTLEAVRQQSGYWKAGSLAALVQAEHAFRSEKMTVYAPTIAKQSLERIQHNGYPDSLLDMLSLIALSSAEKSLSAAQQLATFVAHDKHTTFSTKVQLAFLIDEDVHNERLDLDAAIMLAQSLLLI